MRRAAKPPRPSETPPMLGGAKAALPLRGFELAKMPNKGLLNNLPISILIGGKEGASRPEAQSTRSTPSLLKTFFNIIIILRLFLLKIMLKNQ